MEHVFDLIPGYALGSLDEDELAQVARHLPGCPACRAELDSYMKTVDQLAFLVPQRIPPEDLKEKIMARTGAPQSTAARKEAAKPDREQRGGIGAFFRGLFAQPLIGMAAAAALLLIVVLGASNLALWRQVNELQTEVDRRGEMRVIQLAGTENAPGTRGYLMVFSNENYGTLVVENAPPLPEGYQYQLWLVKDDTRLSGGVFSVTEEGYGVLQIESDDPLESYARFGVTIEPWGGSPGPTGDRVLASNL
jgi:anti-sigma-K factor RskA